MQNAIVTIKALEATNSRNDKEAILKEALDQYPELLQIFTATLDPYVNYYIIQMPAKGTGTGLSLERFLEKISFLPDREITGNDARDLIRTLSQEATEEEWHYIYKRIILKDLKCGVTEKTINKVYKAKTGKDLIQTFSCQLAHDSADHQSKMVGPKIIQSKLDGVRIIAIRIGKACTLYSRTGKIISNFPQVQDAISSLKLPESYEDGIVFDGEIMSASFQDLMKQLNRKDNVNTSDSKYFIFDILPLGEFTRNSSSLNQLERMEKLTEIIKLNNSSELLDMLSHDIVDLSTDDGQAQYIEINRRAIESGYEGIMIKDPTAVYQCKRTSAWLKMKPFIEVTVEIKGYEEGTGKHISVLGGFQCDGYDSGKNFSVSVGGGYTDEQRKTFWESRENLIGQLIEVRADAITKNQDGTYSLRFPRFQRFRSIVAGEKI
jgi:DNA ligase-1